MDEPGLVDRHQPGRGANRHRVQARPVSGPSRQTVSIRVDPGTYSVTR